MTTGKALRTAKKFLTLTAAVAAAAGAFAADRYVSHDGTYGSDVPGAVCYEDLQAAINAAQDGETVYVADGFVCASGIGGSNARISVPNRRITVRSAAGRVDEAQGLGATIRGPGAACADGDQARCVHFAGAEARLIGFVLEDGCYLGGYGGAVAGAASWLESCVIRNSKGSRGGGVSAANCEKCVITNNVATEIGGGVYLAKTLDSCLIAHNASAGYGGGVGAWLPVANTLVTNCWIYGNASGQQGGGLSFRGSSGAGYVHVVGCVISNNTCVGSTFRNGGGCYADSGTGVRLVDCDIVGNVVTNGYGGGLSGCVATGCRIVRNGLLSLGSSYTYGGGAYSCVLTNCVVSFNTNDCTVAGKFYSFGGGAYGGSAVGCRFEGNFANYSGGGVCGESTGTITVPFALLSKCLVTNNVSQTGRGGGVYGVDHAVDSTIVDNEAPGSGQARGGGLADCALVENCVIVGNRGNVGGGGVSVCTVVSNCWIAGNSGGAGGGAYGGTLMNCTLTNNATSFRGGGFNASTLYNCRVVGNLVTAGEAGGGWDGACHNCLIAWNQGIGFKCWEMASELVSCTVTGNGGAGFTTWGADKLRAVNVISWGNGAADKATLVSSNCCLATGFAVPDGSVNCFSEDPRLKPDADGNLVPKNGSCRNVAGAILPWMTDPADVRSVDLAGKPRVWGVAPELGCFEAKPVGSVVIFR